MSFSPVFILIFYQSFSLFSGIFATFLQPKCNFLLYICPRPATYEGRGGDKNINSHPHSEPQKNSVNFLENYIYKLYSLVSINSKNVIIFSPISKDHSCNSASSLPQNCGNQSFGELHN